VTVRRAIALLAVTLLGGASSLLVGCGSGSEKRIPGSSANALASDLDAIGDAVESGRCERAREALNSLRSDFKKLPDSVDPDLRESLAEGIATLSDRALTECKSNTTPKTTPTTTETTTTETTPTTTTETTTVTVPPTTTIPPTTTSPPTTTTTPTTTTGTGGTVVPTNTVPTEPPEPQK
jgi:hypothetical protein